MNETIRFFEEFEYPSYEQWKEAAVTALKGVPFEKAMYTKTYEGIQLEPIYNKQDTKKLSFADSLPGFFPFVRGTETDGYKSQPWKIAQALPYSCPNLHNKGLHEGLSKGQTALNIKADIIWNPENPDLTKDFSPRKLNLASINEMRMVFDNIDLTKYPVYLNGDEITYVFSGIFYAYCKEKKYDLKKIKALFGIDPIGILVREGKLYAEMDKYYDQAATLIKWTTENAPLTRALLVDTSTYHNGGASNIHELAAAMSTGVEYLRQMIDRGIAIDDAAKSIWFTFATGTNFFMEIAKFRAFKMLWAKIVKQFGGSEDAQKAYIHAETSWRENTKYDPYVNILRGTSQSFSATLGGVSSLDVLPFSDKNVLPDEFINRTARNTQNVLNEESHIKDTIDPAGGSWYIETITGQLAEKAWDYFRSIEKQGMVEFITKGTLQKDISEIADLRDKNLSTRKDVLLGTNKYPNMTEKPLTSNVTLTSKDLDDLLELTVNGYKNRDIVTLSGFDHFDNIIKAAGKGAYAFDMTQAIFATASGMEIAKVEPRRSAELFENLRTAAMKYEAEKGKVPVIHLACYGALKQYKPRADFAADFFQTGGFTMETVADMDSAESMLATLKALDSKIIVFCSTDPQYEEFVPTVASEMKKLKPDTKLILAGYPKAKIEEYKKAGIDEFIHVRANTYQVIKNLQNAYIA